MTQPTWWTRPVVLICDPCGVGWDTKVGRVCWVCGREVFGDARQLGLTSFASLWSGADALEREVLAQEPERDWDGDPCSWEKLSAPV
jgi:hypothetical protein